MRNREDIYQYSKAGDCLFGSSDPAPGDNTRLILEVLLDIRNQLEDLKERMPTNHP